MTIEFSRDGFKAIEDAVGEIRARAIEGRMTDHDGAAQRLTEIVHLTNRLRSLLLDGCLTEGGKR